MCQRDNNPTEEQKTAEGQETISEFAVQNSSQSYLISMISYITLNIFSPALINVFLLPRRSSQQQFDVNH